MILADSSKRAWLVCFSKQLSFSYLFWTRLTLIRFVKVAFFSVWIIELAQINEVGFKVVLKLLIFTYLKHIFNFTNHFTMINLLQFKAKFALAFPKNYPFFTSRWAATSCPTASRNYVAIITSPCSTTYAHSSTHNNNAKRSTNATMRRERGRAKWGQAGGTFEINLHRVFVSQSSPIGAKNHQSRKIQGALSLLCWWLVGEFCRLCWYR